jgi:hypothetical protein
MGVWATATLHYGCQIDKHVLTKAIEKYAEQHPCTSTSVNWEYWALYVTHHSETDSDGRRKRRRAVETDSDSDDLYSDKDSEDHGRPTKKARKADTLNSDESSAESSEEVCDADSVERSVEHAKLSSDDTTAPMWTYTGLLEVQCGRRDSETPSHTYKRSFADKKSAFLTKHMCLPEQENKEWKLVPVSCTNADIMIAQLDESDETLLFNAMRRLFPKYAPCVTIDMEGDPYEGYVSDDITLTLKSKHFDTYSGSILIDATKLQLDDRDKKPLTRILKKLGLECDLKWILNGQMG